MILWVVTTNFLASHAFGVYSTPAKARHALENYLKCESSVIDFEDTGDYCYTINTRNGDYWAEINYAVLDAE